MNRRHGLALTLVLGAAAVAAWFAARSRDENALDVRTVVLVTLDTFRADRMASYGGRAGLAPTLDRLAAEGVRFERCLSTAPITLPAHASILTGTDPIFHGARVNGAFRVAADNPFLAQSLRQAGFRTGAFVSAFVLDRRFGLDAGFELYDDTLSGSSAEPERRGESTVDAALAFAAQNTDEPVFLWVHLYDAHAPYEPPEEYRRKQPSPYDDEIAYVDACIARLLAGLDQQQRLKDALIAVVADHGEGLGEHDEMTHTVFVYDATLKVPCVLWAEGRLPAGHVVSGTTSVTSLAPTLLDLLGIDRPAAMYGRSLAAEVVASGDQADANAGALAYFESEAGPYYYGFASLAGAESNGKKLIVAPRPELYQPAIDPGESNNLFVEDPTAAGELKRRLDEHVRAHSRTLGKELTLSAADIDRLRELGYTAAATRRDRRDPKDGAHIVKDLQQAQLLVDTDPARTAELLNALLEREPHVTEAWELLGDARWNQRGWSAAGAAWARALSGRPTDPELHVKLARAEWEAKHPREAEAWLRKALEADSTYVKAMIELGGLLQATERFDEARDWFDRALRLQDQSVEALVGRATCLARLGNARLAVEDMKKARQLAPADARLAWSLAELYGNQLSDGDRAVEQMFDYLRLAPDGEHAADARRTLEMLGIKAPAPAATAPAPPR